MACSTLEHFLTDKISQDIIKTWIAGQHSCTLVIPKEFAKAYGLDEPAHVVIEGKPDGILIRRLEFHSQ